jgi:hypothetical protein
MVFPWNMFLRAKRGFADLLPWRKARIPREVEALNLERIACPEERADIPQRPDVMGEQSETTF